MFEVLGIFVVCLIAGDFIAGFFHWLEDTYCTKGRLFYICDENINHHKNPHEMGISNPFIQRNLASFVLFTIGTTVLWILNIHYWWMILTFALSACGNEIHFINHVPYNKLNAVHKFMADIGIFQSRAQHNLHHRQPYDTHYCVILNFTNVILEMLNFWRRLEYAIEKITFGKVIPQRGLQSREGY